MIQGVIRILIDTDMLRLQYYIYIHIYLHYSNTYNERGMWKSHYTAHYFFNISKARFLILLFDFVSVEGFILYCGATQALISLYIQLIKEMIRKEISTKKLI